MIITVNLANEPYIDSRPIIRGLRVSIVVAAVLTLAVGSLTFIVHRKARETLGRAHALELNMSSLQSEQRAYRDMMHSADVVEIANRADELNQIFDAKEFSWTGVMQGLERVLPGKVQVTAIEPTRTKDGSTLLHLRVVGPHEKSIDLLRNLEESSRFVQPRIVGETLANNQGQKAIAVDASTMMEFDLMVEYNAAATTAPPAMNALDSQASAAAGRTAVGKPSMTLVKHQVSHGGAH